MNAPTPAPAAGPVAAPTRKGMGCFTIGLLTLVIGSAVLVVFSVGAYKRWMRPYLKERITEFRQNHRILALVVDELGLDPYAENDGPKLLDQLSADQLAARVPGVADRSAMPADLPLEPSAVTEAFSVGADVVTAYQRVPKPSAAVQKFFGDELKAAGWKADKKSGSGASLLRTFKKADRSCTVEFEPVELDTEVFIRCHVVQAPPPQAAAPGAP